MTNEQQGTLILRDGDGNFYALTPEILEQARVSEEHKALLDAELEQLEAGDDTSGFVSTMAFGESSTGGGHSPQWGEPVLGVVGWRPTTVFGIPIKGSQSPVYGWYMTTRWPP